MPDKGDNDSESNSSSLEEGDNTEDDEDYVPDPDDLGGDPDGVQVKKLKLKVHICLTCTIGFVRTITMSVCWRRCHLLFEYFLQYLFIY